MKKPIWNVSEINRRLILDGFVRNEIINDGLSRELTEDEDMFANELTLKLRHTQLLLARNQLRDEMVRMSNMIKNSSTISDMIKISDMINRKEDDKKKKKTNGSSSN